MRTLRKSFFLVLLLLWAARASGAPFTATEPVLKASEVRPGMKGHALTVVSGREIVRFPIEIVSVIPKRGSPKNLIMVKASGPVIAKTGGIAAGMSGSPVYVGNKLIGAIGYGWNFSEHTLGLVTPVEDMESVWDWPEKKVIFHDVPLGRPETEETQEDEKNADPAPGGSGEDKITNEARALLNPLAPLFVDGLSARKTRDIASLLGESRSVPGGSSGEDLPVERGATLLPGEAITVLLAWGDVTIGSTGTLTALSKDGRFIGFGHPFLGRGAVNFPVARAYIHSVVPSLESPFKVGSPLQIFGTVTHDRPQAIAGRIGYFTPSISAELNFSDADRNYKEKKTFRFVPDPFMGSKLAADIYIGLIDDLWGRKGQGTAITSLTVHGRGLGGGWTRKNRFFSEKDLAADSLREAAELLEVIFLNPFAEVYPLGVTVGVEFTEEPRLMFIEGLNVKENSFSAGDSIEVEVTLRPYRKKQVKKTYAITVPKDASGECEILVRGGGIEPLNQSAMIQGWNTISNFRQMFTEMSALEGNDELIIEFNYARGAKKGKGQKDNDEPVPKEEQELLSEMKRRRLEDGTLQIFKSDFVVEGLLRKIISVKNDRGNNDDSTSEGG